MDAKKSARGKSNTKKTDDKTLSSVSQSEEEKQSFVDKMKKRATVKTYGIDNVSRL